MENKIIFGNIYQNKKVLVTGNTGFKGTWLCTWLISLGAEVYGLSNNIPTKPSMFVELNLETRMKHFYVDVRNIDEIKNWSAFSDESKIVIQSQLKGRLEDILQKMRAKRMQKS